MTYAWITILEAAPEADADQLRKTLDERIIPEVSGLAGFQKGYWLASESESNVGAVVLMFDSETAAKGSAPQSDDLPVQLRSRGLYRVIAEA
jgi:hypothetical protein